MQKYEPVIVHATSKLSKNHKSNMRTKLSFSQVPWISSLILKQALASINQSSEPKKTINYSENIFLHSLKIPQIPQGKLSVRQQSS